jgi:hypothetical protein
MKEWEVLQSRLHMHGNAKHVKPTPRMLDEQPVFQRFAPVEETVNVPALILSVVALIILLALRYMVFP